jgi:hypothetical protein
MNTETFTAKITGYLKLTGNCRKTLARALGLHHPKTAKKWAIKYLAP